MRTTPQTLVLMVVSLGGCLFEGPIDRPGPVTPIAQLSRCDGISMHLARIRVVDDPQPFREVPPEFESNEWWVGIDVTIAVEQIMPATRGFNGPLPTTMPPAGTFRVHLYVDIDRSVRSGNFARLDTSMIVRGRRLLVAFPQWLDTHVAWPFNVIRTDPGADALVEGWYQFAPGTPAVQVLDPLEWNGLMRGCSDSRDAGSDATSRDD